MSNMSLESMSQWTYNSRIIFSTGRGSTPSADARPAIMACSCGLGEAVSEPTGLTSWIRSYPHTLSTRDEWRDWLSISPRWGAAPGGNGWIVLNPVCRHQSGARDTRTSVLSHVREEAVFLDIVDFICCFRNCWEEIKGLGTAWMHHTQASDMRTGWIDDAMASRTDHSHSN